MSHSTSSAVEKVAVLTYGENGRPRSSAVSREKANQLVQAGRAFWICDTLIVVDYDKKSFRKQVFLRDNHTCVYCGQQRDDVKHLTIDHVVPKSKGGVKSLENCVTACKRCNSWKSNHDVTFFRKTMQFFMKVDFSSHYCKSKKVYPQLVLVHIPNAEPIPCCRSCNKLRKHFGHAGVFNELRLRGAEKWRIEEIRKGIQEADAGHFASKAEVDSAFSKWA